MNAKKIGVFYGSSTCYTEFVAEKIISLLGNESADLHNISETDVDALTDYDFLVLGIPTWDYGELQEDWEAVWDDLDRINLKGKTCAVFGLGDQIGYEDWFQDAIGYLYFKLAGMGATHVGHWPNEGYDFKDSKGLTEDRQSF